MGSRRISLLLHAAGPWRLPSTLVALISRFDTGCISTSTGCDPDHAMQTHSTDNAANAAATPTAGVDHRIAPRGRPEVWKK